MSNVYIQPPDCLIVPMVYDPTLLVGPYPINQRVGLPRPYRWVSILSKTLNAAWNENIFLSFQPIVGNDPTDTAAGILKVSAQPYVFPLELAGGQILMKYDFGAGCDTGKMPTDIYLSSDYQGEGAHVTTVLFSNSLNFDRNWRTA